MTGHRLGSDFAVIVRNAAGEVVRDSGLTPEQIERAEFIFKVQRDSPTAMWIDVADRLAKGETLEQVAADFNLENTDD